MRASRRVPMPDLDLMLNQANALLEEAELPVCESIHPVSDGDTANPTVIGYSPSHQYVVKAIFRHPDTLSDQLRNANWFRAHRSLPVPKHLCHAKGREQLPLMIMEWMPGEQLRLALPSMDRESGIEVARDWGQCLARLHSTDFSEGKTSNTPESAREYWRRSWYKTVANLGSASLFQVVTLRMERA